MSTTVTEPETIGSIDWQEINLYRFFAFVLAPPTPDCYTFLSQPVVPSALADLWNKLGCEGAFPGFAWLSTYELYESAYIALFEVGVPEPPVPLFESAHNKSRPAQEIALENTYFYGVLGLKSDPSRGVPDYLITQLEFLSALRYLAEHTPDEEIAVSLLRAESEFIGRHLLNWIPDAVAKLNQSGAPGFPVLMTLLERFIKN